MSACYTNTHNVTQKHWTKGTIIPFLNLLYAFDALLHLLKPTKVHQYRENYYPIILLSDKSLSRPALWKTDQNVEDLVDVFPSDLHVIDLQDFVSLW